ncbi:MAG: hypothetical protein GWO07_11585 [Candidatus Dadabacteria bacterium]|nr:hypothetical protein [Candidatus Dadabacteria bacterium]NIV41007.1 hypothetical protein [Candidatus Dadabacteria bacterium]NIX15914.1 hypothetical protein [Candidatus Dadabacteria bacterium]
MIKQFFKYHSVSLIVFAVLVTASFCLSLSAVADDSAVQRKSIKTMKTKTATLLLTPDKDVDTSNFEKAAKLRSDYDSGRLSKTDSATYKKLVEDAEKAQMQFNRETTNKLTTDGTMKSCKCTATCQTIVWASNAGSYEWSATGTVSSPSACADAAVATCGGAYSSFLVGWTCK